MSRRHPDQHPHRDDPASYSLDELSREAGVTPRTVRYYIAEGLLPPPDSTGRNARYSQDHLDRLLLIGGFKEQYLPLKEIRARITSMSPEDIQRAASMHGIRASESRRPPHESSAEDYLARVLQEPEAPYVARRSHPASRAMIRPPAPAQEPNSDRAWRRIPITADAELLITEDAWNRRGDRLRSGMEWIRRMLED